MEARTRKGHRQGSGTRDDRRGLSLAAKLSRDRVLAVTLGLVGAVMGMVMASPFLSLLLGAGGFVGQRFLKAWMAARRKKRMEQQLPDALGLVGNAMTAGFSLVQALAMVAREVPQPLGTAFETMVSRVNLGVDVTEAMEQLAVEMESEDFETVVMAVAIQRRTGGNLPAILETVAATIRERHRLADKLHSLTAQGRLTAVVVALLPVILLMVMSKMMPEYVAPLFHRPLGRVLLGLAAVLEVVGLVMVHRISQLSY